MVTCLNPIHVGRRVGWGHRGALRHAGARWRMRCSPAPRHPGRGVGMIIVIGVHILNVRGAPQILAHGVGKNHRVKSLTARAWAAAKRSKISAEDASLTNGV